MSDLIDTTEMYLKVVFELEEQRQPALRARLAERLDQAMPSVSQTVSRLERDGLLRLGDERIVELTDEGRHIAVAVMRKHRVAERFLFDVLGLDWADCHEEACRWEHVLGDAAEEKLAALLTNLDTDPYGNPIPGLEELGFAPSHEFSDGVVSLAESVADGRGRAQGMLKRLGEPIQSDAKLLRAMRDAGLVPGANIVASVEGKNVTLSPVDDGGVVVTSRDALLHLFIVR
jgi:DtxR family Mn-dependent transcriptional regulator